MSVTQLALDQSVMRDLHRHLRGPQPQAGFDEQSSRTARPDASYLVEAISSAAASISAKDEQIRQFERRHVQFEDLVERMQSKLAELMRSQQKTDALARSETERADRADAKAIQLGSRIQDLESDLNAALADLHRIADVVTGSLVAAGTTQTQAAMTRSP